LQEELEQLRSRPETSHLPAAVVRWFTRKHPTTGTQILYAKCWEMRAVATDDFCGWDVVMQDDIEVPQHLFLKTFPEFERDAAEHDKPNPSKLRSESWQ
jgi:hypothetical protein